MNDYKGKYHDKKENKKRVVFYCPYCNKKFKSKVALSLHMMSCTRG